MHNISTAPSLFSTSLTSFECSFPVSSGRGSLILFHRINALRSRHKILETQLLELCPQLLLQLTFRFFFLLCGSFAFLNDRLIREPQFYFKQLAMIVAELSILHRSPTSAWQCVSLLVNVSGTSTLVAINRILQMVAAILLLID